MAPQQQHDIPNIGLALIPGTSTWGIRFSQDIQMEGAKLVARDVAFKTDYWLSENWRIREFAGRLTPHGKPRLVHRSVWQRPGFD